jgi:hypothetical protein
MDVAAWLRGLGLERYEQAFRDNEIDEKVLSSLTAEDLKDLGVTLVGHRRRLLDAIAALRAVVAPAPASATVRIATAPDTPVQGAAERRQLSVMFCDLVGSTVLSARLDPEDLRAVIGAFHRCVAAAVERAGGFVAKYMGDGVLAYFGYPRADEHDAERAVRAALKLVEKVAAPGRGPSAHGFSPWAPARACPVLDTGGGRSGGQHRRGAAAAGANSSRPTSGVRSRPCNASKRLSAALPRTHPCGLNRRAQALELDGTQIRVLEQPAGQPPRARRDHHGPRLGQRLQPRREVRRLADHCLFLRRALTDQIPDYHQASALHPFITQLEHAAGFSREDLPEARLAKLEALLARSNAGAEEIGFIAERDVDSDRRQIPSPGPHAAAAQGEDIRGAPRADGAAGGAAAGIDAVRGRALDRPDLARAVDPDRGAGAAAATAAPGRRAAGVHPALARRRPRHDASARPPLIRCQTRYPSISPRSRIRSVRQAASSSASTPCSRISRSSTPTPYR